MKLPKKVKRISPKTKKITLVDFNTFFARISQLERENKSLHGEDIGLKLETKN